MNPGQVQCLQPEGDRLAAKPQSGTQTRAGSWLKMFPQRRQIALREPGRFLVHGVIPVVGRLGKLYPPLSPANLG